MAINTTYIYKTFDVALELKQTSTNPTFSVIEGDTGNRLHITVTDGGSAVDLTGCRVIAAFSKSNGTSMQDSGVADNGITIGGTNNNEVTVDLFASSLAPGNVECELQIYSGLMQVLITTARFNFVCRRGIMNEDVLLSTNEYPLLVDLISTVEGFIGVEAARVLAEQGRVDAEAIRVSNENARIGNENLRVSAESDRSDAENIRGGNESTRKSAETARVNAESARANAETLRVNAETARGTAESNRAGAETARANAESLRVSAEAARVSAESGRAAEMAKWASAEAVANTLAAGSSATATLSEVGGVKRFTFGIPKGADGSGTGDMSKSTYDTDDDGIVDKAADADMLGGKLPSAYQEAGDYASPATSRTITLGVAAWTGEEAPFQQTVSVQGATATNVKVVSPAYASIDEYASCGVKAAAEGAGSITFACATVPENDLAVNVAILG